MTWISILRIIVFGYIFLQTFAIANAKEGTIGKEKSTYKITKTWNNEEANATINVSFSIKCVGGNNFLLMEVEAPFYNNPVGPDPKVNSTSDPFHGLWEYEVVEAFFLGGIDDEYLEIELSPTGHYLMYYFQGERNKINGTLPLPSPPKVEILPDESSETGEKWIGEAYIPLAYFPNNVTKFNAYGIHIKGKDEGGNKTYMALFPLEEPSESDEPDFHKLELFGDILWEDVKEDDCKSNGDRIAGSGLIAIVFMCFIVSSSLKIW